MNRLRILTVVFFSSVLVAALPTSSQDIEVSKEGKWRMWYTGPDLRAELGYHWADTHLGDEWMILKLSIAGGRGGVTSVARTSIHLEAPDGAVFDLPTEPEFRQVRGSMSMAFRQENVWGPAAARFTGSMRRLEEWFYSPQGRTSHRETIHPSPFQYCSGPLVFRVPGGVQPGSWKLIIDLEETRAEIPFVLGEHEK
ncbi:MAG: hypothetical protein V2I67_13250 [Thermoanaerobaculales bacterium]|nr:hypothetical protein [Thermoanaerobaculales bacterium]